MKIILCCFMGLAAGYDLVKREIPGWLFWAFATVGIARSVAAAAGSGRMPAVLCGVAGSMAVGLGLLLLGRVTEGAVGEGDGWFFLVTGLYVSWRMNLGLLCYGLLLCCSYGMALIVWGRVKGISVRKRKMPFLPFVCLAGLLMAAGHMWEV